MYTKLIRQVAELGAALGHELRTLLQVGPRLHRRQRSQEEDAQQQVGSDGWLLAYVYDAAGDSSDLVILDTSDLTAAPVATIHLPAGVPYGFHGNWIPEENQLA